MSATRFICVIFAILVSFTAISAAHEIHKCNHEEIKVDLSIEDLPTEPVATTEALSVDSEKKRRLQGASTFQPIRISFDLAGLQGLEAAKYDMIVNQVLPAAQQVFQSFVSVLPLTSNLTLSGKKCYQANIDPMYAVQGIANTDLLIFATYDTTTTNLLAWATACSLARNGKRPIAGQINFAALNLKTGLYNFEDVLKTVLHEMIHVLVFSPSLFNYYVNADGTNKPSSLKAKNIRGVQTTIVTLPSIVEFAKNHVNCPSIEGAELENQGTSASKGAHWERRVFGNELMTSSLSHDAVLSNLTMNLFEESGWYVVDRSKAGDLQFGKNQGCNFVDGACLVNGKTQFPTQFCDKPNVETCSPSYKSKAACPVGKYGLDIPSAMDYFGDGQTGTNDMFADNCPAIMNTNNGDCTVPSNLQASNSKFFDEVYGGSSRCFSGNFIKESAAKSGYNTFNHGTCLKSRCQSGTLTVTLGDQVVICPVAGGAVSVPGYRGSFNCPPAADFCYNAFDQMCGVDNCGGVGLCIAGKCYCPPGVDKSVCDPNWSTASDAAAAALSSSTDGHRAAADSSTANLGNISSNSTIQFAPISNQAKSGSILDSILCSSLFMVFLMQFLL